MYSIGIDIGTTNCKLCVFELPSLKLVDSVAFQTPKVISEYGSDFDITSLYNQLEKAIITLIGSSSQAKNVKNIVIASVGESGVLINEKGEVVGPAITWYDTRTKKNVAEINQKFTDDELYAITGIPVHSNYSLTKILWIRKNIDLDIDKVKWLCIAEYIAYKLTEVKRAEPSLASRTLVYDLKNHCWSQKIASAFALNHLFCDLVQSGKNIAKLKPALAQKLNCSQSIMVSIGGHDHMCGSIAAELKPGEILNSTGTTEGLLLLRNQANFDNGFLDSHLSNGQYVIDDLYTLYASLPSAGYSIEWFKRSFSVSDDEFNQLIDSLLGKLTDLPYLKANLSIFIPHLRGSGPPKRNIDAKGLWYGFDENSTLSNILLAVFQGLCFELKNTLTTIEQLTASYHPIIKVIGAAAKNPLWLQLKADILGREIISCNIKEAVCKGAVMLAGYQNHYIDKNSDKQSDNYMVRYIPNLQINHYYNSVFKHYYQPFFDLKNRLEFQSKKDNKDESVSML